MLGCMHIEHEVDQCPFKTCPRAPAEGKPGSGDFGGKFEIENAQVFADIPVRLGCKIELRLLTPMANNLVITLVFADRSACVRDIGYVHDYVFDLLFQLADLGIYALDLI